MDENYIDIVRKSLYGNSKRAEKSDKEMPRKPKRIRFSLEQHNSEFDFTNKVKSEKIQRRKVTPFKKKKKVRVPPQNGNSEDENGSQRLKNRLPTPFKRKIPKKRKVVISFSSSDEDLENNLLSPSKSELDLFQKAFKKPVRNKVEVLNNDKEENVAEFNLARFFNAHELSFSESIVEPHSGIDYEFLNDEASETCSLESGHSARSDGNANYFAKEVNNAEETIQAINDKVIDINVMKEGTAAASSDDDGSTQKTQEKIFTDLCETPPLEVVEPEYVEKYKAAKYYNLEDRKIVAIKKNQSIGFYGLFMLRVLYGKLEILGTVLDEHSNEINLYSPRGTALLRLKNVTNSEIDKQVEITTLLPSLEINDTVDDIFVDISSAIFQCTKLDNIRIPFLEKYISQQIFPSADSNNLPRVLFEPTDHWNSIKESCIWDETLNNIQASTKLLIAGGKGVGKSTFLRFAINRLLNKFNQIRVVDLDPGQSEFAIPGCVSVVTVTDPVLGPNYTHLRTTDRSFLSNINVGYDPNSYIKCVDSLATYLETMDKCPTLINYMGFVHGIGINLISSVITYIQPTDVVQIMSKSRQKNFQFDLTVPDVLENCNLFKSSVAKLDYKLHTIPALNDDNDGWALEPRQSREMCVLAYLGRMMSDDVNSLTSHNLPMYEIKLSSVKITNLEGEDIPPAVANANLVALCSLEEDTHVFVCLGYGIVRGINLESETLVLVTPELPAVLEEAYYLVVGSVLLPPSIYMTPDDIKGNIPYVMQGELTSLGQITKRTYLPVNKKKGSETD